MTTKMVNYNLRDSPYKSKDQHGDEYSPDIVDTLRSLKEKITSFKVDNDKIIQL